MAKKTRKVPDVNTSSTADIAFLLLIFFLVTSSMDTDSGLARQLPPPPQDELNLTEMKIQKRNLLVVLVNSLDQTMVGDTHYDNLRQLQGKTGKQSLKDKVKEFVINANNNEDMPELFEVEFDAPIGKLRVTKDHVISLQNDNTTSYKTYLAVQNELVRAYNELRDEASRRYFNRPYEELSLDEQELIRKVYPQKISEAEPKRYGGNK